MSTWFSKKGLKNFQRIGELIDVQSYLEIGVFKGSSFFWVLDNLMPVHAVGVDPYMADRRRPQEMIDEIEQAVRKRVAAYPGAMLVRQSSFDFLAAERLWQFDLIYIDGSHLGHDVLADAVLAWPLLKEGGVIVFDDWIVRRKSRVAGLQLAIKTFQALHQWESEVLFVNYQVGIRKVAGEWNTSVKIHPDFEVKP